MSYPEDYIFPIENFTNKAVNKDKVQNLSKEDLVHRAFVKVSLKSGDKCTTCSKKIVDLEKVIDDGRVVIAKNFNDEASLREFCVSNMCQACQDDFFEGEW